MTATIIETGEFTDLFKDLAPPCQYPDHDEVGTGPAVWIITLRPVQACGCPVKGTVRLLCDACWTHLHSKAGKIFCRVCKHIHMLSEDVISAERI